MMGNKSCCFTGHRRISSYDEAVMKYKLYTLLERLIEDGVDTFYDGGAVGFDMMCASAVIRLRKVYPHIRLHMILPCKGQDKHWSTQNQKYYKKILEEANSIFYTSENYDSECMHKRNRYMVDNSDICVAYYTGGAGGTAYTVDYAKKAGRDIYYI